MNQATDFFRQATKGFKKLNGIIGAYPGLANIPFFEPNEAASVDQDVSACYQEQPLLMTPRTKWPNPPKEGTVGLGNISQPSTAGTAYSDVPIFTDFNYTEWERHVQDMHNFLVGVRTHEWASSFDLPGTLRAAMRGVEHAVCVTDVEINCLKWYEATQTPNAIVGDYTWGIPPNVFKAFTNGKRFYPNFVYFDQHWTGIIWDKRRGSLYFFDSSATERRERVDLILQMWKAYMNLVGYGGTFDYCVVPCTEQPGTFECGYLTLFWMVQTLRGLVGCTVADIQTLLPNEVTIETGLPHITSRPQRPFDLRLRDWCLFSQTRKTSVQCRTQVLEMVQAIAGNEIGIYKSEQPDGAKRGKKRKSAPWAVDFHVNQIQNEQWTTPLTRARNATKLGGWTPIEFPDLPNRDTSTTFRTFPYQALFDQSPVGITLPSQGQTLVQAGQMVPPPPGKKRKAAAKNTKPAKKQKTEKKAPAKKAPAKKAPAKKEPTKKKEPAKKKKPTAKKKLEDFTVQTAKDGVLATMLIPNVTGLEEGDDGLSTEDQNRIQALAEGAKGMTTQIVQRIGNEVHKNRPDIYAPRSDSYFSLAPPGLMDESCWTRITAAVMRPSAAAAGKTRDQRAAARDARRAAAQGS